MRQVRDQLTDLKDWWDDLHDLYSTVVQAAVMRIEDSIKALSELKQQGCNVGSLNWKAPAESRSFTYVQSGFEFDSKNGQTVRSLSKLADIPLVKHREIPDDVGIKEVTIKKEPTGEWYACFAVDGKQTQEKPDHPERCVGIDVGILKYAHDTDGTAVESLDLSDERERLERAQRDLSRKEHRSNNWEKQRQIVAQRHAALKRKRRDFLHKLSNHYATECDLVAVEDLDAKGLVELPGNSRSRASAAWGAFRRMVEYKCEREGTHFVAVDPKETTKECTSCGVKTEKPLWVREHSCLSCVFEADRDANAAINILSRGLSELQLGAGYSEETPVETALPVDTPVSAKRVVESGSPTLKKRIASAVSE